MIHKLLEQIFPTTCGICGKLYKEPLCNKCKAKIDKETICKKQYKYFGEEFVKYVYLFRYKEILRKTMLLYKFKEKIYLYEFFVKIIIKNKKSYQFLEKYDIIIPVPIHYKKMKYRGYNQCELIAEEIAKNVEKMQYRNDILVKTKNNLRQSSLKSEERKDNVKNVYMIKNLAKNKIEVQNKNILLFDDICTTGSTISECIITLRKLEPKSIGVLTIFKD